MQRTLASHRSCLGKCAPLPIRPAPRANRPLLRCAPIQAKEGPVDQVQQHVLVGLMSTLALLLSSAPAFAETDLSSLLAKRYAEVKGEPVVTKPSRQLKVPVSTPAPAPKVAPAAAAAAAAVPKPTPPAPAPKEVAPAPKPAPKPAAPIAKPAAAAPAAATPAATPTGTAAAGATATTPAAAAAGATAGLSTPVIAGAGALVAAAAAALGLSGNKKKEEDQETSVGKKITKAVPAKLAAKAPLGTKVSGKPAPSVGTKITGKAVPGAGTKVLSKTPAVGTKITKAVPPPKRGLLTPATAKVIKAPATPPAKKAPIGTKVVGTKITGRPQPVGTKVVGTKAVGTKITRAAPTKSFDEDENTSTGVLGGLIGLALLLAAGITLNTNPVTVKPPEPILSDTEKELVSALNQPKQKVTPSAVTPPKLASITPPPAPAPAPAETLPTVTATPPPPAPPAPSAVISIPTPAPAPAKTADALAPAPISPAAPLQTTTDAPGQTEPLLQPAAPTTTANVTPPPAAVTPPPAPAAPAPPAAVDSVPPPVQPTVVLPKPTPAPVKATPAPVVPAPAPAPVAASSAGTADKASNAPLLIGASVALLVAGAVYASSQGGSEQAPPAAAAPVPAPSAAAASTLNLSAEDKDKLRAVYRRLFKNENFRKLWTAILTSSGLTIQEEKFEEQLLDGPLFDQLLPAILKELPADKVTALLQLKDDASIASLEAALSEVKVDEAAVAQAAKEVTQEVKQSLGSA